METVSHSIMELGNVTGARPIHGFLSWAAREIVDLKADGQSAWLTTKLDVYRNPQWMAQFPLAHTVTVTQRLRQGELEVTTKVENLSSDPMPLAIGLFRADDRNYQCDEPGPQRPLQELQMIPPHQTWQESFWIRPSGF